MSIYEFGSLRDWNHDIPADTFDPTYYRYLLMGKIDNSNHAFLFDVSGFSQNDHSVPKSVDHLYKLCTPAHFRNRMFNSDHNNDCGIQRILIGCFLTSMTTTKRKKKRYGPCGTLSHLNSTCPVYIFNSFSTQNRELVVMAQREEWSYDRRVISGKIHTGYYSFETGHQLRLVCHRECLSFFKSCVIQTIHHTP